MVKHCIRNSFLLSAIMTALCLGAASSYAQNEGYEPPRLPSGKPDFNGVFMAAGGRHNYNIEPHSAKAGMAMMEGPLGPIPAKEIVKLGSIASVPASLGVVVGGEIPYKPEALEQRNENRENFLERDPEIKCYLPGVPRANYMPYAFQIFHNDDALFFAYEYAGAVRNILLEDPGPAPVDSWMGQSWSRWDDDTLVIETTAQNGDTWLDRAGNFIGYGATVTERYTWTGPNTVNYEVTIENPEVFTEPWKIDLTLYKMEGKDAKLMQFKCVEFVEELMYGHLRKDPVE